MNLISANATNSAIFQNIAISLSCIAMLVALTKERIVKTVAGRCGSVLIPLSLCSIALHADLLIINQKKVYLEVLGHLMTEFSAVPAYNPYTKYCRESFCNDWKGFEEQASRQGVGLWSDKNPMAPWDWRHSPQKEQQVSSNVAEKLKQQVAYKESVSSASVHGNSNSRVYHNSGCQYYNCKNCTGNFSTGEEARKAGYRACQKCGG